MLSSWFGSLTRWAAPASCILAFAACTAVPEEPAEAPADGLIGLEPVWQVTEGIDTPESAYVHPETGEIFVSVMAGEPTAQDGVGWIMRLGAQGQVLDASWVDGLSAPKGLRAHDGVLWTADISQVVGFDLASGDEVARLPIEGAQFLNDVAIGGDGTVYVSDMATSTIHAIRDGAASVFAAGPELEYPNGLLVEGDRLIVAAWGEEGTPGRLYALDLATGQKTLITPDPVGTLDGVESDGRGGYLVTDWTAGRLLQIAADGAVRELGQFEPGTADLGVAGNMAILPHMQENRIAAYDVSGLLQ